MEITTTVGNIKSMICRESKKTKQRHDISILVKNEAGNNYCLTLPDIADLKLKMTRPESDRYYQAGHIDPVAIEHKPFELSITGILEGFTLTELKGDKNG